MFSNLLGGLSEVLAPTIKSDKEDFIKHWRAIKHFYVDQNSIYLIFFYFFYFIFIIIIIIIQKQANNTTK